MKLALSIFMLFMIVVGYAVGQKQKSKQPCEDEQTQGGMNICWGKEFKKADAGLNKTYQQLMGMLDADDKTQLKNVETAWIKYRDANCDFVGSQFKGGTMQPMIYAICMTDVTNNRTTELKNQIKDRNQ